MATTKNATDRHGSNESQTGATGRGREPAGSALDKVSTVYGEARESVADAYHAARDKVVETSRRAADGIEENPVVAVVGGIALGAIAAALLPQGSRETKALGVVGGKLNQAARGAVDAAREAGKAKIGELGLDSARDNVRKIVESVTGGASS